MKLLIAYITSVVISLLVMFITTASVAQKMKREGYKGKSQLTGI